jgi:hypothetical protein
MWKEGECIAISSSAAATMNENRPEANDEGRDDTANWRYMDLPTFVAMLASNTLWFAKAAHLEDCYEASAKP